MEFALKSNSQRFILASIAVFAFLFFYEIAVYNYALAFLFKDAFTPLIKPEEPAYFSLSILLQVSLAIGITCCYNYLVKRLKETPPSFGVALGLFMGTLTASRYLVLPVSISLGMSWFLWSINEGITIGFLLNYFYRLKKD